MSEASPVVTAILGPVKPAFRAIYLLVPLVLLVAAVWLGRASYVALRAEPSSTRLRCTRTADRVQCEELLTWVRHPEWGTRALQTFEGPMSEVRIDHAADRVPQDCFALGDRLVCDADAQHAVEAVRVLLPEQSVTVDATPPPSMQRLTLMAAGALLLGTIALLLLGNALGRNTRVLLEVHPTYLEADTRWAGFWRRPRRRVERVVDEQVRVVLTSPRRGRGTMPVWRIEYGNDAAFQPLFEVVSFAGQEELEEHAERARKALRA